MQVKVLCALNCGQACGVLKLACFISLPLWSQGLSSATGKRVKASLQNTSLLWEGVPGGGGGGAPLAPLTYLATWMNRLQHVDLS